MFAVMIVKRFSAFNRNPPFPLCVIDNYGKAHKQNCNNRHKYPIQNQRMNIFPVNIFAFAAYIFAWIFPTVLFVVSVALFVTILTENYSAVLLAGLIWLFCRPSVDKLAGGNYGLFDLIIRHNTLKGYGRMIENIHTLILNRVLVSVIAI